MVLAIDSRTDVVGSRTNVLHINRIDQPRPGRIVTGGRRLKRTEQQSVMISLEAHCDFHFLWHDISIISLTAKDHDHVRRWSLLIHAMECTTSPPPVHVLQRMLGNTLRDGTDQAKSTSRGRPFESPSCDYRVECIAGPNITSSLLAPASSRRRMAPSYAFTSALYSTKQSQASLRSIPNTAIRTGKCCLLGMEA